MNRYATAKQIALITALRAERNLEPLNLGGLTIEDASAEIARLFAIPRPKAERKAERVQVTEAGIYRTSDGTIYKVQRSRETGNLYAKRLNVAGRGFTYAQGAIYALTPADRLTLAEAKAFGFEFGICCVCGAELSDPKSVAQGIGPVCAKRWF